MKSSHFNSILFDCEFHLKAKRFPKQILFMIKLVKQICLADQQKGAWIESDFHAHKMSLNFCSFDRSSSVKNVLSYFPPIKNLLWNGRRVC